MENVSFEECHSGSFVKLENASIYPIMIAFNSVPKVAIVPVLVIWFGIGVVPAIITAFAISFFPIVANVATGLATIEPEMLDVMRILGASKWKILVKIGIPRAMPFFFASLKVAIDIGIRGVGCGRDGCFQRRHREPHDRRKCTF
jgi:NitT/TauT family transport system permease protein